MFTRTKKAHTKERLLILQYSSHKQMQCVSHHFNFTKNPILLHDMTGGRGYDDKTKQKYPYTYFLVHTIKQSTKNAVKSE